MVSKGSCYIENWSNFCWRFSFTITGINYILKHIKIENLLFQIVMILQFYMVSRLFLYTFFQNSELHLFQKHEKTLKTPNFRMVVYI